MKTLSQIVAFFLVFLAVFSFVAFSFITINGLELYQEKLSEIVRRPVTIEKVKYAPPFGIHLYGVESPGALSVKSALIHFGIPSVFPKMFVIASIKLNEPVFFVRKDGPSRWDWLDKASSGQVQAKGKRGVQGWMAKKRSGAKETDILIHKLSVVNGRIQVSDFSSRAPDRPDRITISNINLNVNTVMLPLQSNTSLFDLRAFLAGDIPFPGSRIESRGTVNFKKKDIDAKLDIIEADGRVGLRASLKSIDNVMLVNGELQTRTKGDTLAEDREWTMTDIVLNTMQAVDLDVGLNFAFETKMDDFSWNMMELEGVIIQDGK